MGSVPELCQSRSEGPSARHLKSSCLRSLGEKALKVYLYQRGAKSSHSLMTPNSGIPLDAEAQRTRWDELALSSLY